MSRALRAVLLICAYLWAEWICVTTHLDSGRAWLRQAAGIAPLLMVIFWNVNQRKNQATKKNE